MSTKIVFPDGFSLVIDTTVKKNHGRKATLTKHKVENGAETSDHRIKENYTFSLEGIINETAKDQNGGDSLLVDITYERIEQAYDNDELLDIITPEKTYNNMTIAGYSFPREASQGKALFFSLEFEELRFATTKTVQAADVPKSSIAKNNPKLTEDKKARATRKLRQRTSKRGSKGKIASLASQALTAHGR